MRPTPRLRFRTGKRRAPTLVAATLATVAAIGCNDRPDPNAVPMSRTLAVAWSEPVSTVVPPSLRGVADLDLLDLLYTTLTRATANGTVEPELAAEWNSDDGRVWRFTLRADARFHDGTPIHASDVVRSWTVLAGSGADAPFVPLLAEIEGVLEVKAGEAQQVRGLAAPDSLTLVVTLLRPLNAFPAVVSRADYSVFGVADSSTTGAPRAVGSGRWALVQGGAGDSSLLLARAGSGGPTSVDSLLLRVVPLDNIAEQFAAGTVQCVNRVLPGFRTALALRPDLLLRSSPPDMLVRLVLRRTHPQLADARVRAALAHAIDLDALARSTGETDALITGERLPVALGDTITPRTPLAYNPERARTLLQEAGATDLALRLVRLPYGAPGDTADDLMHRVRDYWRAVGVQAEIVAPPDAWRSLVDETADIQPFYHIPAFPDAAEFLARIYGSESPLALVGTTLRAQPALDSALAVARASRDRGTRGTALSVVDSLLAAEQPDILLWHSALFSARVEPGLGCDIGLPSDPLLRTTSPP